MCDYSYNNSPSYKCKSPDKASNKISTALIYNPHIPNPNLNPQTCKPPKNNNTR